MPDATFVFLVSPRDLLFADVILRHLLRMCDFPFREVVLIADDLPRWDSSVQTQGSFQLWLDGLLAERVISRYILLSNLSPQELGLRYFGSALSENRDYRGIPLFGWIAGIETSQTDFVIHFDSDILLYQEPGRSWIHEGFVMMRQDQTLMFASPLPGPPAFDGSFPAQNGPFTVDALGNLRLKNFSSRGYMVSKTRFQRLLPTHLTRLSYERENRLCTWEYAVEQSLRRSKFDRVHLRAGGAWYLHCPDHGARWVCALPDIIRRVESNCFPAAQGGYYELFLDAWTTRS